MINLAEYRRSQCLADFLPWVALVAPGVVLNKDGSFQRTVRFRGPDLDSATPAELVATTARLNNALRRLGSGWAIFIEAQRVPATRYPESRFPDAASGLVDAERRAQFEEEGAHFESRYFLTLLWLPPVDDAARAEAWLYEGRAQEEGADWRASLAGFTDRSDRVLALIEGFMPEAEWLDDAETLTYLHSCISTRQQRVRVPETPTHLDAILRRAVDGKQLGEVAENVLPQLDCPRDLPVHLGVEVSCAAGQKERQKLISRGIVAAPVRLANEMNEALGGQIFGVASVTDESPPLLGGEVLHEDGVGCRFDLWRPRIERAIGRLLKRSGHDAPFRQQRAPGAEAARAEASIGAATSIRKCDCAFFCASCSANPKLLTLPRPFRKSAGR